MAQLLNLISCLSKIVMKEFKTPLNTAVFTTKYVIENLSTIVYVSHDDEDEWQFQGSENDVLDIDIRIVGLGEIIKLDNTLLELAELPVGFEAIRKSGRDPWQIVSPN